MKIFIPGTENYISGPKTFLTNLRTYLQEKVTIVDEPLKSDILFFPVEYDLEVLRKAKKRNIKIVQRLDGIYYPQKHDDYEARNKNIQEIYLNYADHVVFQSEYSKKQCFEMLGQKNNDEYTLIINGVNKEIFIPNEKDYLENKIKFVSTGNFRNIDMIEPLVNALDELNDSYDFEFNIVGTVRNPDIENFFKRDYIKQLGELSLEEVSSELRKNDIFLFSHLNPPCPNSVIEAISCALPVVGFDSGAMSELLFFSKDLLADVSSDVLQTYSQFDYKKLKEKIILSIDGFSKYKELALNNSNLYSFDSCGDSYLTVFQSIAPKQSFISRLFSKI